MIKGAETFHKKQPKAGEKGLKNHQQQLQQRAKALNSQVLLLGWNQQVDEHARSSKLGRRGGVACPSGPRAFFFRPPHAVSKQNNLPLLFLLLLLP